MGGAHIVVQAAPPPPAPEEQGVHEVEVPADLVIKLTGDGGRGLQELKQKVGADISIPFQHKQETTNWVTVVIRGPKINGSLAAILVLQQVSELIDIPV